MYDLTAAHKTLPMGSKLEVKNLDNGKQVKVRINDRGPFIEGRVIDLSYAAAKEIGMIGPGVALVRLYPQEDLTATRYGVQVGAFHDRDNAERLQTKLSKDHSPVKVSQDGSLYHVLVGAENSEAAANSLLKQLRAQKLFGMVVMIP
jgi:rare lipoprotein A